MSGRKIVHIDMDAFYASVEQRDHPDLRGKPLVVAWRGKRSVICARPRMRLQAIRRGARAMAAKVCRSTQQARRLSLFTPDFTRYKAASARSAEIFLRQYRT